LRILYDTRSTTKSLAYILLVIFLPIAGIIFYFSFGMNYRKRKMYSKKLEEDGTMALHLREKELMHSIQVIRGNKLMDSTRELAYMLCKANKSPLRWQLCNPAGEWENKFPGVLEVLKAEHHIHIKYYIYVTF
jgi:cardiolipin synthase